MTNNCEIVSNVACGKEFQYCRTHRVEPHQCPGVKQEVVFSTAGKLEPRKGWTVGVDLAAPAPKREFKAGDKVRILAENPYNSGFHAGDVLTVRAAKYCDNYLGWDLYFEGTPCSVYSTGYKCEPIVEHV